MPATIGVYVDTGLTPTGTDTSIYNPNIRFKTNDSAVVDTNDPIPIPTSGVRRSYIKWVYLKCTSPPSVQVNQIKFYTDGVSFGTGITVYVGTTAIARTGASQASYVQATGTVGTDGTEMVTNVPAVVSKVDAVATHFDVSSAKSVPITETGNVLNATGETSNYLVFQMDVASTASPGDLANRTWTFQYDEI